MEIVGFCPGRMNRLNADDLLFEIESHPFKEVITLWPGDRGAVVQIKGELYLICFGVKRLETEPRFMAFFICVHDIYDNLSYHRCKEKINVYYKAPILNDIYLIIFSSRIGNLFVVRMSRLAK